ncbi:flagellar hook-length control protein FliK [Polaromonas sp. UC242_47]|uniref:flagellar hook-length control protein FliK n=1 Tax=Polaromonas sp. UC242_47 TaxID=3374626 RepID=UPI00379C5386
MSFILPPSTAPSLSGPASSSATARQDDQGQNNPGSFGEALSKSMAPSSPETSTKTANTPATRRPADEKKTEPDDLINAMTLVLPALDIRTAKIVPTGGAGAAIDNTAPTAEVSLADLLADSKAAAGAAAQTPETDADTGAETALQPLLAALGPKDTGQTAPQAKLQPVSEGPLIQVDLGKIAGQQAATNTSEQSSKDNGGKNQPGSDRPELGATPATSKLAPTSAAPALAEAAVSPPVGHKVSIDAVVTASTSSVSPANPVVAGIQGSGTVSVPHAPQPVVTATLRPEVGSPEWGKALGQQVIQMGTAGHQVAELQLNPPGLGPLKVTLSMNEQQVQAMFVSAHSSVRAAVEAALPQLRTTLADSGISLGNTSVSSESQQQTAFAGNPDQQPGGRAYRGESSVDASALPARPVAELPRRSSSAGLDTYA